MDVGSLHSRWSRRRAFTDNLDVSFAVYTVFLSLAADGLVRLAAGSLELSSEQLAQVSALYPSPPPATDRSEERSGVTYGAR